MSAPRVVVVGGGLAGITAALDCADAGAQVTLVEVRPRLGGAVYSFAREGLALDNGQHVFLRCFHAYRALLERLGSSARVQLQRRFEIPVMSPDGRVDVLRRSAWLPAPLHLGGALLRYGQLSVGERLRAALAARALGALDPADPELDRRTLGSWLSEHGQSPRAIAALWDLIALPSLNLPADEASLALGAFVFRTGLLASADAGDMGFHMRPLSEIVGDPALAELRRVGVEVRLSWRARGVEHASEGLRVRGESSQLDSSQLDADAVIVAVPHQRAGDLIESLAPEAAAGARALGSSPIVNVHVVYDRRVCELAFVGGVDTPVQYVFDRTAVAGLRDGSQYLTISLSGAEAEMGLGAETLRARYLDALAELFPRARVAHVARFFLTREHAATFRAAPGVAALRPAARTETLRLALAGAYTDTGWPGTLEGAVLSGHAAAREALQGS